MRMTGRGEKLSLNQLNIWNLEQVYGGVAINNIATTIRVRGRVDFALLQETLNLVISHDPTVRTRIAVRDGEAVQYTAPYQQELFPVYDFSGAGEDGLAVWEETTAREAIFALDAPLGLPAGFTAADALRAMHGHVLAEAAVHGTYSLFDG